MVRSLIVAGPTASGKSALAMAAARAVGGEIISCDSVQLYRGFDIGSAKPTAAEQAEIPHHLLDVADWHDNYDAARFAREARQKITEVASRGRMPVIAGGTGLYLRAMLQQDFHDDLPSDETLRTELRSQPPEALYQRLEKLDPRRAAEIHPHDQFRVIRALEINLLTGAPVPEKTGAVGQRATDYYFVVLDPDRKILHARIAARARLMLEQGLLSEVRQLIRAGVDPDCKPMQSIGYKQCVDVIAGRSSEDDLYEKIVAATRQYAKRQCTWFRKTDCDLRIDGSTADSGLVSQILAACQA
jgi:tRNA dimethylallyltransferase